MEKLYIATSTLNFNNILATESISPVTFYARRNFGYKRFTQVEPNPFPNSLIAYDKLPIFQIEESGYDDYPMIIEIQKELIQDNKISGAFEKNGIKIFQLNKTIYLHPNKVKFLFFNENDRKIAIIKSEPSIETKLLPVYNKRFVPINKGYDSFQWNKSFLENISDLSDSNLMGEIEFDSKINKLKGFYYSYFLGIILSMSTKEKTTRENLNSISDLLIKLSGEKDIFTNESLDELEKIQSLVESTLSYSKKQLYIRNTNSISQITEFNFNEFKIIQLTDDFLKDNEAEIFRTVINVILDYPIYNTQTFQGEKIELALKIGVILKDYYSDWNNSEERNYINSLLDNIENYKPFNLKSHPSILLQSIALFILKGDEPEKLVQSLSKNKISDYRIALGLWGSIFGFSALPKTLTNILFQKENIVITRLLYNDVQFKLHNFNGKCLPDFESIKNKPENVTNEGIQTAPKEGQTNKKHTSASTQSVTELEPITQNKEKVIVDKLKGIKLKSAQIESIISIYRDSKYTLNGKFFILIKKIRGIGDKTVEKIKYALEYDNDSPKESSEQMEIPLENKPEKDFYKDSNAYSHIEYLVPENQRENVKTEIEWIQKAHKDNGYKKKSGEWIELDDHTNYSVIKHFENNTKKRIEKELLKKIVKKLRKLYP
jgi:hypothetical protein